MSRYEPLPREDGIADGLAARIHDPLWLLTRQWQFGEFRGEDAGSTALAKLDGDAHRLDSWRAGAMTDWAPYDPAAEPLERLVEQEPARPGDDPRLRAQGGARLARLLRGAKVDPAPFAARYAFLADAERAPRGLPGLLHARLPDGAAAAAGLRRLVAPATRDAERAALGVAAGEASAVDDVATAWLEWWEARAPAGQVPPTRTPEAWDENRAEYAFSVRSGGVPDTELAAAEYLGGRLDWFSVDAVPATNPPALVEPVPVTASALPGPARFGGMPASRFWEMEDARIDLGSLDAAPNDLGRLLMVSFATVYGNDWMVAPVRLPVGSLVQVRSLVVTDVFGATEALQPAGAEDPDWNLFGVTDSRQPSGASPWFLMAPALPGALESGAIEQVRLARDELANVAWAIEQRVEDAAGRPLERYDAWAARPPEPPRPVGSPPRYRVETEVPDHWLPLVPEQLANQQSVRLRLVPLVRERAGTPTAVMALGALLAAGDALWLHEEEIPRSGATVSRSVQRARWHDGSVHTWTARRKGSGLGESSSGLRFDAVEPGA